MTVVIVAAVVAAVLGAVIYGAATQPCENGFHRRHWRFRRFRPGGCSALD
ncbi:MAG: hypothetical protein M3256_19840 [Actinomycetota bacterium]|nr:hypothetical protein [Actinomycetota bacterium]